MVTNYQMSHKGLNKDELPWGIQGLPMSKRLSQPCTNHTEGQVNTCVTSNIKIVNILLYISWNVLKQETKLSVLSPYLKFHWNVTTDKK